MRIATVTLNPAIDQTVRADGFRTNTVNRGQAMQFDAGGKGVNVASFLADYGYATAVTGFLGQENAQIFEQLFAHKRIEDHFVRIPGSTRIGVKIVDEANRQTTDINMPGLQPSAEAISALLETMEQLATSCDWFALSGNLPPGAPTTSMAGVWRWTPAARLCAKACRPSPP
jgi:1-phosphofructokinase